MVDMTFAPRVSVIIIFFNEAGFLMEAIESVRRQSFGNWELILVDDGSTDGSSDIAIGASDGERIRYVCHPNHANCGMSASRNAGLAIARGEFVAFLDGDDVWPLRKLAEQVAVFEAVPQADMIYGRAWIWHRWEQGAEVDDYCHDLGVKPGALYPPGSLLPLLIQNKAQTPMVSNAIMRRTLTERVEGFDARFRGMFEDQVFFAKAHLVSHCYVDDRCWLFYRQHGASCTAQSAGRVRDLVARHQFLRWLSGYIRGQRAGSPKVRWAIICAEFALIEGLARLGIRRLLGRR